MSHGDIRAYYAALEVELPEWATHEASCRCFANPDAHQHQDRNPSCSVNLESGAWCCHGCGSSGGAYDAAIAKGHNPRTAIDLMITHRLTQRREPGTTTSPNRHPAPRQPQQTKPTVTTPVPRRRPEFTIAERDIHRWAQVLASRPTLLQTLRRDRGWTYRAITELELGLDQLCQRITIPIRDHTGALQGLLRYNPAPHRRGPKMRAAPGTRLGLIPHPARDPSERILLVEGPPDMIAARSRGLPAIAVPGTSAWRQAWASQLAGRHITVIMDSDTPGRHAAAQISADLRPHATVTVIDLAPSRDYGYDLTDHLLQRRLAPAAASPAPITQRPGIHPFGLSLDRRTLRHTI